MTTVFGQDVGKVFDEEVHGSVRAGPEVWRQCGEAAGRRVEEVDRHFRHSVAQ